MCKRNKLLESLSFTFDFMFSYESLETTLKHSRKTSVFG